MTSIRRLVRDNRGLTAFLLLAVLSLRIMVPTGFMPVADKDGTITVRICSGTQDGPTTMEMAVPGLAAGHGDHHKPVKAEMPCAFAGLAMPMLAGTDPLLLALAMAFIMAMASRFVPPASQRRALYLRPPLREPPIAA